jgi:hypothetical protein
MKFNKQILSLILFFYSSVLIQGQEKYTIKWVYKNQTFKEFVAKAEKELSVKFFFKEEWVEKLVLSDYPDCTSLPCILDKLFSSTTIYYYIDDSGKILLTNNYAIRVPDQPQEKSRVFILPTDYGSSNENLAESDNVVVEIGNPGEKNNAGNVVMSGYVTNRDTKDPISGVTVYIKKISAGSVTNEFGYYSLTVPRGSYHVQLSFIGMREKDVNVNLYGAGILNVEMASMLIPLKETVISAQKSVTLQRFEVGVEKVNITSFKLLPTSLGESDIIKSMLLIPGVQSVGEGSAGFNVRGGSADQNLILLYGAPIYNSSHFFGFFSAVNSDIIKDVTLYKGGIPGRYGGRISSVLDIGSTDGNKKEFEGNAGISPIMAHIKVEGPIIKDTLSYIITARSTYSNWILSLVKNPGLRNSRVSFYDINGKLTYDLNKNNRLELSAYSSKDSFKFNSDSLYDYENSIIALKWRHFYSNTFLSNIYVNNSTYKYDISNDNNINEAFTLSHKISSSSLKADFNWFLGRNEVNFGTELIYHSISPGIYMPLGDSSIVVPHIIQKERALEGALYIDDKFTITSFMSMNIGLRMSAYSSFGPASVYLYDPDFTRSRLSVIDTVNYKGGEVTSRYAGPEMRMSLNFRVSEKSSFKINYNRTRQYIHLLSNSTSIAPTDTWTLSDKYIKPQIGDQVALGFYQMLKKNTYEFSAEVYYKEIKNMVDFKGGTKLVMNENIEREIIDVKGKAYGLELVLKKVEGKVRFNIGYTYARTFIKSLGAFTDEVINSGNWFPANFDKPNDFVLTFNYLYSRRFSFSANYTRSTGRPITYPIATYHLGDKILIHYSDRNAYRIPDYSRLDISFRVSGNLKAHKIAHPSWTFSVFNLFGRENVYSVYFKQNGDVLSGYKLSIFGQAIPSVTFSFDF